MKYNVLLTAVGSVGLVFLGACNGCGEESSSTWHPTKQDAGADAADATVADATTDKDASLDTSKPDVAADQSAPDAPADSAADAIEAQAEAAAVDADFSYDGGPLTPWEKLPTKCTAAAEKGVVWLAAQQKANGAWGTDMGMYSMAATGLAVVKLETYALEHGKSPFSPNFQYKSNVEAGLSFLFQNVQTAPMSGPNDTNSDGLGVTTALTNYVSSIVLMAVAAGQGFNQTVNSPGSPVHGWKFQQVAQDMTDYFAQCQAPQGGWRYSCPSGDADNSVSQYVSLGIEYAVHPDYQFFCNLPASVSTGLWTWVGAVQDMNSGGSGYTSAADGPNPYRTGALLQELAFLKQGPGTVQVDAALNYLNGAWAQPMSGNPADYMAMWSIMKGLVGQGVTMVGAHDWYQEYCDLLVSQQNVDGSWPMAQWDTQSTEGSLSAAWALLILEKAAPAKLY
ncbi:MAG: hypothetical protein HY898_14500 [Deltaproteobacteria bacterium]|nr:hypothetical protein [Deltaproteobacteria bacterium]